MGIQPHSPAGWHKPQALMRPLVSCLRIWHYLPGHQNMGPSKALGHQATQPAVLEHVPPSSKAAPALRPPGPSNKLPQDPWAHNQLHLDAAPPTSGLAPTLEPLVPAVNLNRRWLQPSIGWDQFQDSPWLVADCTRIQACPTAVNSLHPRQGPASTAISGPTTTEALTQPM